MSECKSTKCIACPRCSKTIGSGTLIIKDLDYGLRDPCIRCNGVITSKESCVIDKETRGNICWPCWTGTKRIDDE